jgi:hypothetical protein
VKNDIVENHVETAGNKLHDVTVLLHLSEKRGMNADDWIKLSRVVRHALAEVRERLCGECTNGDLIPTELRKQTLQQRAQLIAVKQ